MFFENLLRKILHFTQNLPELPREQVSRQYQSLYPILIKLRGCPQEPRKQNTLEGNISSKYDGQTAQLRHFPAIFMELGVLFTSVVIETAPRQVATGFLMFHPHGKNTQNRTPVSHIVPQDTISQRCSFQQHVCGSSVTIDHPRTRVEGSQPHPRSPPTIFRDTYHRPVKGSG